MMIMMIMGVNPITMQNKASPYPSLIPLLMIGECSSYQPISRALGVQIRPSDWSTLVQSFIVHVQNTVNESGVTHMLSVLRARLA